LRHSPQALNKALAVLYILVVMMGNKFNKDMEKYIKGRRSSRLEIRFPSRKKKPEEVPEVNSDEITVEHRETWWSRLFRREQLEPEEDLSPEEQARLEAMEQEIEAVEEAEEDATDPDDIEALEEARESLIERLFNSMRFFRRRHQLEDKAERIAELEEEEAEQLAMDEDMKEVLKITHKWLGKLMKRYKDEFKKSKDYGRYVEILEKYGVAKKK